MVWLWARRLAGVLLLTTACGRSALPDRIEATPEPMLCGQPRAGLSWSTPVQLTDVDELFAPITTNPTYSYFDPTLRDDGLTLYLASDAANAWRTFELTRASVTSPFSTLRQLPDDVTPPSIGVFGYQRVDAVNLAIAGGAYPVEGNPEQAQVYVLSDPRQDPVHWSLPENEDIASSPGDARLTATGRTIIYASRGLDGDRSLYTQSRASLAEPFDAPVRVQGLPDTDLSAPWLSADERVLLFVRDDAHTADTNKIWAADREASGEPFGNLAATNVNGEHFDGEPYVVAAAGVCELYFISIRTSPYPRLFRAVADLSPQL